jgi:hypothetical protein
LDAADDGLDLTPLAIGFERWRMVVASGAERPTSAEEWADALVIVEHGAIEVVCRDGSRQTYPSGSILCLSWVTVARLRNHGPGDAVIAAVRRRPRPDQRAGVPLPT